MAWVSTEKEGEQWSAYFIDGSGMGAQITLNVRGGNAILLDMTMKDQEINENYLKEIAEMVRERRRSIQ
jgi:hypothetical protein